MNSFHRFHRLDGENSHPNIQSNDPSKLVDTSVEDVNNLPNDSSTYDSSVFESNTKPDDHIDSYRRFRSQQENTYSANGYGFLRNTEMDSKNDINYTFVTNVICDILNDANMLVHHYFPPTFIQDLMERLAKKDIFVREKDQLDRVYALLGSKNQNHLTCFYNRILDLYFEGSSITCRMYVSNGSLVYDSKIAPFFDMSSLRARSNNSCEEALDVLLSFIVQKITGFRDDMVIFKDKKCSVPSVTSYYRTVSDSSINTDSLMRRTTFKTYIDPKRFVWRCRPHDEEYRAMTLSICAILNHKYVTKIPRFLFRQLSDRIINGDIPI